MGRLQQTGASLLAAIWLAGCSAPAERWKDGEPEQVGGQDTEIVIDAGAMPQRVLPGSSLFELGQLGQNSPRSGFGPAAGAIAGCDDSLPNDLVTREIYRRLNRGDAFKNPLKPLEPGEGATPSTEPPIKDRIAAYRSERLAFYDDLFACRKGNETIHELARTLAQNPNNRDAFTELYVALVEQRGDEVLSHYTTEDFQKFAELLLDTGLRSLQARYSDIHDFVQRDAVVKSLRTRVAESQEELALHALKSELVLIFQAQNGLPANIRTDLQTSLEKIVAQELINHIGEQVQRRMTNDRAGFTHEI